MKGSIYAAMCCQIGSPWHKSVLTAIATMIELKGIRSVQLDYFFLSISTDLPEVTIRQAVDDLVQWGLIEMIPDEGDERWYRLTTEVIERTWSRATK